MPDETQDQERSGQLDYDPRWEVQPEPVDDDDGGSNARVALIALLAVALFVALLAWRFVDSQPAL